MYHIALKTIDDHLRCSTKTVVTLCRNHWNKMGNGAVLKLHDKTPKRVDTFRCNRQWMDFEYFILLEWKNLLLGHLLSRFSNFLRTRSQIKVEVCAICDIFTLDYLINRRDFYLKILRTFFTVWPKYVRLLQVNKIKKMKFYIIYLHIWYYYRF